MIILAKIATALLSPLGNSLLLGLIGLILGLTGRQRLAWLSGALAIAWLWFWSVPAVSLWLAGQLNAPFPPQAPHQLPRAEAMVILGGGIGPPDSNHLHPDLRKAADRIWYGAKLYHAGKAPLIILSGGSDPQLHTISEAAAMQQLLLDLGVPASAILLEERSRNTQQNAQFSAELLRQRGIQTLLLVTSVSHMARSLAHFQRAGLNPIPAATDYTLPWKAGWRRWIPDTDDLDDNARMLKELIGQWVGPAIQWRTPAE